MNRNRPLPITPFMKEYSQIVDSLLNSFVPMKGVPICLMEDHPLYFAGTTATVLLALHHMKALPSNLYQDFHETLFWLRDNTHNLTVNKKLPEDSVYIRTHPDLQFATKRALKTRIHILLVLSVI